MTGNAGETWSRRPALVFVLDTKRNAERSVKTNSRSRSIGEIATMPNAARIFHHAGARKEFRIRNNFAVCAREPVPSAEEIIRRSLPTTAPETEPARLGLRTPVWRSVEVCIGSETTHALALEIGLEVGILAARPDGESTRRRGRDGLCAELPAVCDEHSQGQNEQAQNSSSPQVAEKALRIMRWEH